MGRTLDNIKIDEKGETKSIHQLVVAIRKVIILREIGKVMANY